ncbi:hypothetical protein MTR67_002984 [Solanum verrucosum]|nr:hypothetical protein MTR67_002984 [Solanum verrucosum]
MSAKMRVRLGTSNGS